MMQNPYSKYQNHQQSIKPKKQSKQKPKSKTQARRKPKQSTSKKGQTPVSLILMSFVGLVSSFYVSFYTDDFLDLVNRIEIGFSTVVAADEAKTSTKVEKSSSSSDKKPVGSSDILKSGDSQLTMKNASVYEALKNKQLELDKKERRLARLEEDLQKQKDEIEKQLKELMSIRRNISSKLDKKVTADKESVEKLVGVYSNMKPQNAATIISQLDEDLAIKILGKMKKQVAGAILNYVQPAKAQVLSEKYAGLKK